jgi:hypothetical protein
MIIDSSLEFLKGQIVLYYAGLDSESFPFFEGKRLIDKTASAQIIYLKLLALVADVIVVPPSFYFYWTNIHKNEHYLKILSELYNSRILISPIYETMNFGTDYLELKMTNESSLEKNIISSNHQILKQFFREIPVLHRNVHSQSKGYKELFINELELLPQNFMYKSQVEGFSSNNQSSEIVLSREQLHSFFVEALKNQMINRNVFRRYFLAANRSYYQQGATTHGAKISVVGAERYAVLRKDIFFMENGILIGYDPLVILSFLSALGVSSKIILEISIDELIKIRNSLIFQVFRDAYYKFVIALQELAIQVETFSRKYILNQ